MGFCPYFLKYLGQCFCFKTIKYCIPVSKLDLKKNLSETKKMFLILKFDFAICIFLSETRLCIFLSETRHCYYRVSLKNMHITKSNFKNKNILLNSFKTGILC